jgi:hypothetical protein
VDVLIDSDVWLFQKMVRFTYHARSRGLFSSGEFANGFIYTQSDFNFYYLLIRWSGRRVCFTRTQKNRRNNNFDGEKFGGILIKNKLIIIFFEFQSRKSVVRFVPSRIRQLYRKKTREKNRAATLLRDKVASLLLVFFLRP